MAYSRLSHHYDRLMGDFPYQRYYRHLAPYAHGKGLDLACGTGRMTMMLRAGGMSMQGVDLSPEMLNIAAQNARNAGLRIDFRLQDMRRFSFGYAYDLITSVCDGFNYVAPDDLSALFARCAAALNSGGHLVFDLSTPYKLREVLGNNLFYEDYDDLTYFWQNKLAKDKKSVNMSLTFFEKEGETYRRYDESHTQYWHTAEDIDLCAAAAGLHLVSQVDGDTFERVKPHSKRIVYIFVKN